MPDKFFHLKVLLTLSPGHGVPNFHCRRNIGRESEGMERSLETENVLAELTGSVGVKCVA